MFFGPIWEGGGIISQKKWGLWLFVRLKVDREKGWKWGTVGTRLLAKGSEGNGGRPGERRRGRGRKRGE